MNLFYFFVRAKAVKKIRTLFGNGPLVLSLTVLDTTGYPQKLSLHAC